jgi:hypothetical protein
MRRFVDIATSLLVLLSVGSTASAQGGAPGAQTFKSVSFNHKDSKADESRTLRVGNGETFKISILDTCEDLFTYDVHGVLREEKPPSAPGLKGGAKLQPKVLTVVHDTKYGGYIVTMTRKNLPTVPCEGAGDLASRTLVIFTPQEDWDLSFSGAFTLSSLSNPMYYLRAHPDDATKKQVQEDTGKSDAVNLGIGAFVHLFHQRHPWAAGTFGLGIREGNKMEYFLGGGLRASDKATINAGIVFGPVNRLPNGVDTTRPVSDDNVLNDLPTRIARGFFVGISYSFIDVRNKFQTPFAGSGGGNGGGGTGGGEQKAAATPEACAVTLDPSTLAFAPGGETKKLIVKTEPAGCAWKITAKPAWVTFLTAGDTATESGSGETTLSVKADANATASDRAEKDVKIGNASLSVTQGKKS